MISDQLHIAVVGLDIVNGNPAASLDRAYKVLAALPADTQLAVLPELFTTAFIPDEATLRDTCTEAVTQLTVDKLHEWASEFGFAIAGSFSAYDNGNIFNRAFFVTPDSQTTFYDKKHLFTLSTEYKTYTPGASHWPVVNYLGWNIAITICYELRFPVWQRNTAHRYDLMIVPANWPNVRRYAWEHLLIARAIENQAVYVGADRAGVDDYGDYDGLCRVYDHMGKPIGTSLDLNGTETVLATPSLEALRHFRRKLPVIDAADDFRFI